MFSCPFYLFFLRFTWERVRAHGGQGGGAGGERE